MTARNRTDAPVPASPRRGKAVARHRAARRVGASIARACTPPARTSLLHYRSSAEDAAALAGELNALRPARRKPPARDLLDVAQLPELVARRRTPSAGSTSSSTTPPRSIPRPSATSPRSTGTTSRHQPQGAAVPRAGGLRRRCANARPDPQHRRHPRHRPLRRYPVYSVAKAGLIMLTKSLARELGPHVRVNAVAPGPVMWPEDGLDTELQEDIIAAPRSSAWAPLMKWHAPACSSQATRPTSPARCWRSTAAGASAGEQRPRAPARARTGIRTAACGCRSRAPAGVLVACGGAPWVGAEFSPAECIPIQRVSC